MKKIQFDNVIFDTGRRELTSDCAETVQLRPLPAEALAVMLDNPNIPVSKEMLIERCWSSSVVTDQALTNVISKLRKALNAVGAQNTRIKTITKLGYVLEVDGQVERLQEDSAVELSEPVLSFDLAQVAGLTKDGKKRKSVGASRDNDSVGEIDENQKESPSDTVDNGTQPEEVSSVIKPTSPSGEELTAPQKKEMIVDDKTSRSSSLAKHSALVIVVAVTCLSLVISLFFAFHALNSEFFDRDQFVKLDANSYYRDSHLFVEKDFQARDSNVDFDAIMADADVQALPGCAQSIYLEVYQALFDQNRVGIKMYAFNKGDRGTINIVNKEVGQTEIKGVLKRSFMEIRKICHS
ncbi:winged helix-turn-helix domain-containing protein [Veronia pacifica]|uniref:OmpR/PhoB-type domain-containing protein n=1 Tax=Veronia pacifica TaxID=1080227 RepID=A0A1C3EF01_9GAMM|nr:winged helix-turn-helix domain-containing protein [Veronia pacifica]ODA31827.1 hypothetical protein A8L45_15150 [Veronia pacifica]